MEANTRLSESEKYFDLYLTKTPPTSPVHPASPNISARTDSTSNMCDCRSPLEEEAANAVVEFAYAVQSIRVSEMLPRTSELIFLNITTLEGSTYCIELTVKGWRITSMRADCMNGNFLQLGLHTEYFEHLYQLLDTISPKYRECFANALFEKLNDVKLKKDSDNSI